MQLRKLWLNTLAEYKVSLRHAVSFLLCYIKCIHLCKALSYLQQTVFNSNFQIGAITKAKSISFFFFFFCQIYFVTAVGTNTSYPLRASKLHDKSVSTTHWEQHTSHANQQIRQFSQILFRQI